MILIWQFPCVFFFLGMHVLQYYLSCGKLSIQSKFFEIIWHMENFLGGGNQIFRGINLSIIFWSFHKCKVSSGIDMIQEKIILRFTKYKNVTWILVKEYHERSTTITFYWSLNDFRIIQLINDLIFFLKTRVLWCITNFLWTTKKFQYMFQCSICNIQCSITFRNTCSI